MTAKNQNRKITANGSPKTGLPKKKLLLVDDHPMMRQGLAQVVNQQKDLVICGEAVNAAQAMQRIKSSQPDLAVVDISLDGKSGLELIKDVQALHPEVLILVMSMHDESLYAERVLRAGAHGYVMKKSGGEAILQAIRHVLEGKVYLSHRMSEQIVKKVVGAPSARRRSPIELLTDREFEVFKLLGEGCVTREIAGRLHISPRTVDVHRQNLKKKLNLPNATSTIQHAVRWVETQNRT